MHGSRSLVRRTLGGLAAVGLLGGLITVAVTTDSVGAAGPAVFINEFVANHTGFPDENAFVEVLGDASTDYSAYTVLEIEGDSSGAGTVDAVLPVGTTNGSGYWIDPEGMENGTITIMLVEGWSGSFGLDLDTNNDGNFNSTPWIRIVDDVATTDGDGSDITYSSTVLGPFFDGNPFGAGAASRIRTERTPTRRPTGPATTSTASVFPASPGRPHSVRRRTRPTQ
jgi:hypothetical protein